MTKSLEVPIYPTVLKWARETSGTTIEDAATRLGVSASTFARMEKSESSVRLSELRKLAEYFKRPLAAFLLNRPPEEPQPPTDFRVLSRHGSRFARDTRLALRRAGRLQNAAAEIMHSMGEDHSPRVGTARLSDDVRAIAMRERKTLGVDVGTQLRWRDEREAFRGWRTAVERQNVLVFQLHMPIEDARGFSLSDGGPFAIAVSSSDVVHARIFTLFHEYAHLLLRSPGVCNPKTQTGTSLSKMPVERWCNQFAAALLVPEETLRDLLQRKFADDFPSNLWEAIRVSSRAFRVSEQMAVWRLFDLALITKTEFREMMGRLQRARRAKKKGFGQFSASAKCFSENGRYFTSLVLEARGRNAISYADVADYLSLKLKHLPEVRSSLSRAA